MYKLGIIGFGVVGKSVLTFLNRQKVDYATASESGLFDETAEPEYIQVQVWDSRNLAPEEEAIADAYHAAIVDGNKVPLQEFIQSNDFIIPSPGVNLSNFKDYSGKFLCELDFFSSFFSKPIVAISGSLGKTTTTKLIAKLSASVPTLPASKRPRLAQHLVCATYLADKAYIRSMVGGNIGVGMLDLVKQQDEHDLAILELSSFQLDLNKKFAPDIAVWTNWYPNHLDWHITPEAYFDAKFNLVRWQRETQAAILSIDLFRGQAGKFMYDQVDHIKSKLSICIDGNVDQSFIDSIKRTSFGLFFIDAGWVCVGIVRSKKIIFTQKLISVNVFSDETFIQNWLQVVATLYLLGTDLKQVESYLKDNQRILNDHHHRVELCGMVRGVDFYNDSKSTVMQATRAAFYRLEAKKRPIILIVGGLGKGVDRSSLLVDIVKSPYCKKVFCFGKDCGVFQPSGAVACATLQEAMDSVASTMESGDQVLFSPSGASFDFFKNYEHRGDVFKELVKGMK